MSDALVVMDAEAVRSRLSIAACIPLMRQAMIELSDGRVGQTLRSFLPMGEGRTFALMPAVSAAGFGAKLVSVYGAADRPGRRRHQGLVVLFDTDDGRPVFVGDAEEITRIRTAAATAAATDALARDDARVLALLGAGAQAEAHLEAIAAVRPLTTVRVWGRDLEGVTAFAGDMQERFGLDVVPCATAAQAVEGADVVCTLTTASDPVLKGAWIAPGTHVNLVGSSGPHAAEADADVVAGSLFIADHRDHVLAHGGEFLRAREQGRVSNDHVVAEIGEVFSGRHPGRTGADQVTVYKSLGHAAQDLAAAAWLLSHERGTLHG
ncbi:MAG: ornithine cyclodeaminase family protein [Brevundimonas sp.]|uniref:ornithine cyclodeaminase family protein n=1 Tax=Brevundimonas sp. TaxID=1871086 RepID=UPI00391B5BAE